MKYWIAKFISFAVGVWLGMFIMTALIAILVMGNSTWENFKLEKSIDLRTKELQLEKLKRELKKI